MSRFKATTVLAVALFPAVLAQAESAKIEHPTFSLEQVEFFTKEVRPLLADNCFKCHGGKDSKGHVKAKAGLQLISRRGLMIGGDHGPSISEEKPAESILLKMIAHSDPEHAMPPKSKLPAEKIATLTRWVEMKAPWTADDIDVLGKLEEGSSRTQINPTTQAFWSNSTVFASASDSASGLTLPVGRGM